MLAWLGVSRISYYIIQTEGIGTIRSYMSGPAFEDDGLSSDDDDEEEEGDIYTDDTLGAPSEGITHRSEYRELIYHPWTSLGLTFDYPSVTRWKGDYTQSTTGHE